VHRLDQSGETAMKVCTKRREPKDP
jgi:hypothetical protein